eukprot:29120-Pelagococcus_subviridis.AAC.2
MHELVQDENDQPRRVARRRVHASAVRVRPRRRRGVPRPGRHRRQRRRRRVASIGVRASLRGGPRRGGVRRRGALVRGVARVERGVRQTRVRAEVVPQRSSRDRGRGRSAGLEQAPDPRQHPPGRLLGVRVERGAGEERGHGLSRRSRHRRGRDAGVESAGAGRGPSADAAHVVAVAARVVGGSVSVSVSVSIVAAVVRVRARRRETERGAVDPAAHRRHGRRGAAPCAEDVLRVAIPAAPAPASAAAGDGDGVVARDGTAVRGPSLPETIATPVPRMRMRAGERG